MRTIKGMVLIWFSPLLLFFILCTPAFAQKDFIRIGVGSDFRKSKFIQSISIDLNRTEKVDEKASRFILFNSKGIYLMPNVDVNIGDGITASENNIAAQLYIGKQFFGQPNKKTLNDNKITNISLFNYAIELNPTANSDKDFEQRLYYGQLKLLLNPIAAKYIEINDSTFLYKRGISWSFGPYANLGYRRSRIDSNGEISFDSEPYLTSGIINEFKVRWRKTIVDKTANWQRKTINQNSNEPKEKGKLYEEGEEFQKMLGRETTQSETSIDTQPAASTIKKTEIDDLVFKITGGYYYILSDAKILRDDDFAGLVKASLDKYLIENIYINTTYKYGNDNPNYSYVHTLEFGLKFKY